MSDSNRSPALFVVCLGGRAPGCNVELHDVVFVTGRDLEETHDQMLDQWFGQPDGLHVDAWARVDTVAGYRVALSESPQADGPGLYFVNIGGYAPGELWERHAYALYVGHSKAEIKERAKSELLVGRDAVHRDDFYDVDDILEIDPSGGWHVSLIPDPAAENPAVTNGYFPIPRKTIERWRARRSG